MTRLPSALAVIQQRRVVVSCTVNGCSGAAVGSVMSRAGTLSRVSDATGAAIAALPLVPIVDAGGDAVPAPRSDRRSVSAPRATTTAASAARAIQLGAVAVRIAADPGEEVVVATGGAASD